MRTHHKLLLCNLLLVFCSVLISGASENPPRPQRPDPEYPQDIYQLRSTAVQNRTDINNLERRVQFLENTYYQQQVNTTRLGVLEEQVAEGRRQLIELRAWVLTAYGFVVAQIVALLWLGVRYFLDRSRFMKQGSN